MKLYQVRYFCGTTVGNLDNETFLETFSVISFFDTYNIVHNNIILDKKYRIKFEIIGHDI